MSSRPCLPLSWRHCKWRGHFAPQILFRFIAVGSEEAPIEGLASVRRSNGTCSFPAFRFHEWFREIRREGISETRLTSLNSPSNRLGGYATGALTIALSRTRRLLVIFCNHRTTACTKFRIRTQRATEVSILRPLIAFDHVHSITITLLLYPHMRSWEETFCNDCFIWLPLDGGLRNYFHRREI